MEKSLFRVYHYDLKEGGKRVGVVYQGSSPMEYSMETKDAWDLALKLLKVLSEI